VGLVCDIILGEDLVADEPARLADVELRREMVGFRKLVRTWSVFFPAKSAQRRIAKGDN